MTSSLLSIEAVTQAEELIRQRRRFMEARWNAVTHKTSFYSGDSALADLADCQLQRAIEEYRQRKITAINAKLHELGIDPATSPPDD